MDAQSLIKLPFNFKLLASDYKGMPVLGIPFLAMFNPDTLAISEDINWRFHDESGTIGASTQYVNTRYRTFSIEIMLDGTGVNSNGVKIPVPVQVLLFRNVTTKVEGENHMPNYLLMQYGAIIIYCVMLSSTITYTMFDPLGLPIRAKITASFAEVSQKGLLAKLAMFSSPDLTHKVTVKEGDILPLLTYKIYKNQDYYLQVAKANKLKNFRKLKAGTTLVFPPIADK